MFNEKSCTLCRFKYNYLLDEEKFPISLTSTLRLTNSHVNGISTKHMCAENMIMIFTNDSKVASMRLKLTMGLKALSYTVQCWRVGLKALTIEYRFTIGPQFTTERKANRKKEELFFVRY